MPDSGRNRRKHVRLPAEGSSAETISGRGSSGIETLPGRARVVDLSEGGVKLVFEWRGGPFPLRNGDTLSFRLSVAAIGQTFEVMSMVRHVARPAAGRISVGVEFAGLDPAVREAFKGMLMNLALTKLRAGRPGQPAAAATPEAARPPAAASRKAAFEPLPARPVAAPAEGAGTGPARVAGGEQASHGRRRKMFLGEILVKQGAVAAEKLQQFLARAPGDKVPIGQKLISHGLVDDVTIAKALAVQSGLPYLDLLNEKPDHELVHSLPREPFIKHHCVPLKLEWQALVVVMADRASPLVMEELELAAGRRVRGAIGAESGISRLLKRLYNHEAPARFAKARFPVQLRVEYRFFDKDRRAPVHDMVAAGLTRELGVREMIVAGPLPAGVDADRVRAESLTMEVQVEGGRLPNAMILHCRPLSISSSGYAGEYHIACYIDEFPEGGENAWTRLCMQVG